MKQIGWRTAFDAFSDAIEIQTPHMNLRQSFHQVAIVGTESIFKSLICRWPLTICCENNCIDNGIAERFYFFPQIELNIKLSWPEFYHALHEPISNSDITQCSNIIDIPLEFVEQISVYSSVESVIIGVGGSELRNQTA